MKRKIFFATLLLTICVMAMAQNYGKKQITIGNVQLQDGRQRTFKLKQSEGMFKLFVKTDNVEKRLPLSYDRDNDGDDMFSEGFFSPVSYTTSPDGRNLFLVTCVHANGNGWTTEYQLFKIDVNTLATKMVVDCAGVKKNNNGFTVAIARLTNEQSASSTADENWMIHDVHYDWNGKVISRSDSEYSDEALEKKFLNPMAEDYLVSGMKIAQ